MRKQVILVAFCSTLKTLVGVVDAELLERVGLEGFEAKHIEKKKGCMNLMWITGQLFIQTSNYETEGALVQLLGQRIACI